MTRPAVNRQGILWSNYVQDKTTFGWLPALVFDVKSSLAKSRQVFKLRVYLSTDEVFKSWIAIMAGFLLWLSITSVMIEVFKVALAQRLLFLSMGMIYFTMKGIVPSRCRLTTQHLGAILFRLGLYQICKSHVTASMHHGTWGLMQSHFLLNLLKTRLITF